MEVRDCRLDHHVGCPWLRFEVVDLGIARDKSGHLEETLRDALRKVEQTNRRSTTHTKRIATAMRHAPIRASST